jgi:hypothetical protein
MAQKMGFRWVDTADLQIDPRVQGVRRERRVQEIAENWDPRAVGVITVSQREDNSLFVADGQHRTAGALERKIKQLDGSWLAKPVTRLWAKVYEGLTLADEAQLFGKLNNTKAPMALDRIAVAAVAGDDTPAELLEAIARKYGWYLRKAPRIQAPQALYKIAAMDEDGTILDRVFYIVTKAWTHEADSTRAGVVDGLARVLAAAPLVDDDRMARVLGRSNPSTILADIESMRSTFKARARLVAIAERYDRGLGEARKLNI